MCCHSEIETQETEHHAAAEDCVSVHDTPPDGEVCVSTDGKDCWICCMRWFVPKKIYPLGVNCCTSQETLHHSLVVINP